MARRLFVLVLVVAVLGLYLPSSALAQEKIKIGIVKFSDIAHYNAALKGILERLKKEGFDESKVIFDIRDAEGKKEKVTEIAKEFKDKGMKLIMVIGTPAAVETYKQVKDIPVVFSTVFDPINSGIAKSWESSGTNTTGSSTWVEMVAIIKLLKDILPFKKLGVIYTEEEKHSVIQMEECKKAQDKMGFKVIAVNLSKPEDAAGAANSLVGQVEAIYVAGSTPVAKSMGTLFEITKKAKIPMVSYLEERVEQGCLLAISANSFQLGELAGKKAAQVLRGKKPADIPIEGLKQYDLTINMKTAKELDIKIPVSVLKSAKRVIQ